MANSALSPTSVAELPELAARCLDALLILGEVDSSTPLRTLLDAAGVKQPNGNSYAAATIRKQLDGLPKYVQKARYGGGYSLKKGARIKLLAVRATQENVGLQRMATIQYQELQQRNGRGYYYYLDQSAPIAMAILANDEKYYAKAAHTLDLALEQARYYVIDLSFYDELRKIDNPDFWLWRKPELLAVYTTYQGRHPERLRKQTADTMLAIYAHHDFLEIEEFRNVELAGMYLMHRVIEMPEVRRKHFDLDQLALLLGGHSIGDQLLQERIAVINQQADLFDIVILLLGLNAQLLTLREVKTIMAKVNRSVNPPGSEVFISYIDHQLRGVPLEEEAVATAFKRSEYTPFDYVLLLWICCWQGTLPPPDHLRQVLDQLDRGAFTHLPWVEGEILNALSKLLPVHERSSRWQQRAELIAEKYGIDYLLRLRSVVPGWQAALRRVEAITGSTGHRKALPQPEADPPYRYIWIIDPDTRDATPKEQKLGKRGYTPGRQLKWDELYSPAKRKYLTPQDLAAAQALRGGNQGFIDPDGYIPSDYLTVDFGRLLYELVGHPRLYLGDRERIPLELVRESSSVSVAERDGHLEVRFDPPPIVAGNYQYKKITPTRYAVYHLNDSQLALSKAVEYGLTVPLEARERLEASIDGMRDRVTVHSDTDLLNSDLPVVEGSDRISVHLLPSGEGYEVDFLARPLPDLPLYFPPGEGLKRSLAAGEDGRRILERNLDAETTMAGTLVQRCPQLSKAPTTGRYSWTLDEELPALQFLLQLRKLVKEGACDVAYPRGQKLKLDSEGNMEDLELKVSKQRDWFQVDGNLRLDENQVLDLQFLLEQLRNNDSGFVKLKENEFVAITDELRQRVKAMDGLLHERNSKLQLPTLAASEFVEVMEGFSEVELDAEWEESLQRIERARHLRPRPPEPFDADLRPYQQEGYEWMMRLAEWGVGACLADDMGLGKTVQGLAVLTSRREIGPALVLAPASVIRNWRAECKRFAPALNPILMAHSSDKHLVEQLRAGDVLLVSYGLLSYVAEQLTSIEYATIIIDEAQAIKNATTKRARIVSELQGQFKVATTGTPIENHLGELWSLFRFLNPGLLSSKKAFAEKYAIPITRDENAERRDQLRKLVQPFILRRRKDEVLKELPAKTEIILTVEPSKEEAALYEAMRRQALKEISEAAPEEARFKVLAQLTKLRQAACHPRLVRPKSKLPSAKLELVDETINELLDGGHKALVFSQFVKHLKIVEEWVKQAGIPYQYLDGSTPGKKRAEYVDAFQRGEGKLFLISLKAGGTGLNLTEADYVLHLDPWWNPAVEDQASDRAHRIGQQRPVTVYRFVTQGTIEEQVIALHADKRDLADRILEGTGRAGKLEVDEILEMLRQ